MKPVSRIQIDHSTYQGPRLHNDLNKLVLETNDNLTQHQTLLDLHQKTFAALGDTINGLMARIAALEAANA
jgi:hypothetical protein